MRISLAIAWYVIAYDYDTYTSWCIVDYCIFVYYYVIYATYLLMQITIGTGALSSEEEQQTGLVPSHAYAVLDVREAGTLKMLKVKNPWNRCVKLSLI